MHSTRQLAPQMPKEQRIVLARALRELRVKGLVLPAKRRQEIRRAFLAVEGQIKC